ncbi:MAG: COR domain-containing protein, partial [Gammaproteobacteria bacterium]|nr:COR domain-containing protein [Gammaproteobacteria bacterium]
FQSALHQLLASPKVLGNGMLRKWNELNQALQAQYRQKAIIRRREAEQIAFDIGLYADELTAAFKALDILGLALQFDELKIQGDWVVLDPNWIIHSLYHVLEYGNSRQRFGGKLNIEKIRLAFLDPEGQALNQRLTLPFDAQSDAHSQFLLDLLLHFKLAFKAKDRFEKGGEVILSPMLSDHAVPQHPFRDTHPADSGEVLKFEVRFERLLPDAVLHQFAARSAQEVWGDTRIWRTGVWLQGEASEAVVSLDTALRSLTLQVQGARAGWYLAKLRLRLFELLFGENSAYQEAEVECRAYMNGQPFDWQEVLEACAEDPFETLRGKGNVKVLAKDLALLGLNESERRSPQSMQELDAGLNREGQILAKHSTRDLDNDWKERALRAEGERDGLVKGFTWVQTLFVSQKINLAGLFNIHIDNHNMNHNTANNTNHIQMTQHGGGAHAKAQADAAAQAHAESQAQAQALVQQQITLCNAATLHLMDLKAEVGRALTASDVPAQDCDKALRQLGVEVENLLGQVAQHRINVLDSSMQAPQKKQFFDRLTKGWGALNQCLEQINTLTEVGAKAFKLLQTPSVQAVWQPLVECIGQLLK